MKLMDFIKLFSDVQQNICLIDHSGNWIGLFPACFTPSGYDKYHVDCFKLTKIEGDYLCSGLALNVWIKEG